jgi:hypothetical protein
MRPPILPRTGSSGAALTETWHEMTNRSISRAANGHMVNQAVEKC